MPKYLVETISVHRIRYVVECETADGAKDEVTMADSNMPEFSQVHLNEIITSAREIDDAEYLRVFDEDNDYLQGWDEDQKFKFVHRVDYENNC